jgi:hypothetical protein
VTAAKSLLTALSFVLLAVAVPCRADISAATSAEINELLQQVQSSDCIFIRNGSEHDAEDAADHLRLKLKRGKKYVDTTEQFIDRLASESSWTGKPYTIRCPNEDEQLTGAWLHQLLDSIRTDKQAPATP